MKKLIFFALIFAACQAPAPQQQKEYDPNRVVIQDTVNVAPHDRYYQEITVPTRNVSVLVDIHNNSDSAKVFIVGIEEK